MTDGHDIRAIGERLRNERMRAGLSQAEVAEKAGLSASFVRLVEGGRSDISLSRLLRWTSLFELPVSSLFSSPQQELVTVVRAEQRTEIKYEESGIRFFLLATGGDAELEPAVFQLERNAAMEQPLVHQGEETVFVLSGTVRIMVGDEEHLLGTRDSAYYSSELPHRFANADSRRRTELLVTTTHPALHARALLLGRENKPSR